MVGRLEGKVAVITGAASGIGRACAERFAQEGADVVVADLPGPRGEETVAAVRRLGRRALFVPTDTSREAACEALAEAATREFGRIDVLVAAAGVLHAGYVSGQLSDADPFLAGEAANVIRKPVEQWEKVLAVNLTGVMLTDRAVARRMIAGGQGGAIVNIASGAAKVPIRGMADYCVSKAGVWMLTKVLALELAPHRIRVNAIGPGVIDTPMTAALTADASRRQRTISGVPLGRLGQPLDIANTALFLASDEASYFTGELLHPDGGAFTG